jgi:hypothetical protein
MASVRRAYARAGHTPCCGAEPCPGKQYITHFRAVQRGNTPVSPVFPPGTPVSSGWSKSRFIFRRGNGSRRIWPDDLSLVKKTPEAVENASGGE